MNRRFGGLCVEPREEAVNRRLEPILVEGLMEGPRDSLGKIAKFLHHKAFARWLRIRYWL